MLGYLFPYKYPNILNRSYSSYLLAYVVQLVEALR